MRVRRLLARIAALALLTAVVMAVPSFFDEESVKVLPAQIVRELPLDEIDLELDLFARVPRPTAMAVRNGDSAIYLASKLGKVYRVTRGTPEVVLDVSRELSLGFEQGLLGLAFTPDGKFLVVNFTNAKDASVTRVYDFDDRTADPLSGEDLLVVKKPAEVHNAGNLVFGPDDYLYLSLGDGGLSGDPDGNAQSKKSVLGKIHRIQVLPNKTYAIPPDNPFVDEEKSRKEIWDYGFRNPWRFSFDRDTGDLWISDVGRDTYEEVNLDPAGSGGGNNFGWSRMEGPKPYEKRKPPKDNIKPIYSYKHNDDVCAVTGGYVYRGAEIEGLYGAYLFTDFCKGGIEAIRVDDGEVIEHRRYRLDASRVSSFGEDADGEIYVLLLLEDAIYRITSPENL